MGTGIYVISKGKISLVIRKDFNDRDSLSLFTRLIGISKGATHEALKSREPGLHLKWIDKYDTNYPYGDRRECFYLTIWTFDLDNDLLLFNKKDRSGKLPLSVPRSRAITFDDFVSCEAPTPPIFDMEADFPQPHWEPSIETSERNRVFISRLIKDFDVQWRHVLRNRYNKLAFQKLAVAIIKIATLDFRVKEFSDPRPGATGNVFGAHSLPEWEHSDLNIVAVSGGWIVISQNPLDALEMIREHQAALSQGTLLLEPHISTENQVLRNYLILSIRHVILCRADGSTIEYIRPEPFLNGTESVSERALDFLLHITAASPPQTPIHHLPAELQDCIIRYLSQGSIEVARLGCVLDLGSPFSWTDGRMKIGSCQTRRFRLRHSAVMSEIWFDWGEGGFSGLIYQGMRSLLEPPFTETVLKDGYILRT